MVREERPSVPVVFELPWPPSTNHYWRHVELPLSKEKCPTCRRPFNLRTTTLISSDGRTWLKTVDGLLHDMHVPHMYGPLDLEVVLCPPNRRSFDVDNRAKSLLDSLKRRKKGDQLAWLFGEDDSQVERLTLIKGPVCAPSGKCIVKVSPIVRTQVELSFAVTRADIRERMPKERSRLRPSM